MSAPRLTEHAWRILVGIVENAPPWTGGHTPAQWTSTTAPALAELERHGLITTDNAFSVTGDGLIAYGRLQHARRT